MHALTQLGTIAFAYGLRQWLGVPLCRLGEPATGGGRAPARRRIARPRRVALIFPGPPTLPDVGSAGRNGDGRRRWRAGADPGGRALEFAALYLGLPLMMALALPPDWVWPVLLGATALGVRLLARTPGFAWGELACGWRGIDWGQVALVGVGTAAVAAVLVWWLVPGQALMLPRRATGLWLAILALYPLLSALPQELMFRPLFFRRYGALFPDRRVAVLATPWSSGWRT